MLMFNECDKKQKGKGDQIRQNSEQTCDNDKNVQEEKLTLFESPVTIIQSMHVGPF